jgi:signal transduction histidine kinase
VSAFTSVRSKLLLVLGLSLTAVTVVNVGMSAYLASRQGDADAQTRLAQHLLELQDELQRVRQDLGEVARRTASDEKNLSDLATVYSEEQALDRRYDAVREQALRFHKTASVGRLRVVAATARLTSLAVYVDGALSHYVTADGAGLAVREDSGRAVLRLANGRGDRPWRDGRPIPIGQPSASPVPARLSDATRATSQFVFPTAGEMELRVVVPIQAVTRPAFDAVVAEHLSIVSQAAGIASGDGTATQTIGAFVFSERFGATFLERFAERSGVLPAVLSPDGRQRLELIAMQVPAGGATGAADGGVRLQRIDLPAGSFYQATRRWRQDPESPLILGAALSTATTVAGIRRTVGFGLAAAIAALALGLWVGSAAITRMVTPIKALTAAAASMGIAAAPDPPTGGRDAALHLSLGRYLDAPVDAPAEDEVGTLTRAFNAMAARLHSLIDNLHRSNEALEAANARLRRAETDVQALNVGLERQVRERTAELEIANKELESFSYSVSHDLRAPLRGLDGFSRALIEDYGAVLDDTGRDYLGRIRRASQQMGQLIDDLIDLARVTRVEIVPVDVDLSPIALAVVDELRAAEPSRQLEFDVAPDLQATCDPRLLQIVLRNLLHNACKFTGTRPVARIAFGETTRDGERAFFVRDNGVGFDAAYAHKLFGAFQRLHAAAEFPGTGIGLATVHRIVLRHGGRVAAESHPEGGATFFFTLPGAGARPA